MLSRFRGYSVEIFGLQHKHIGDIVERIGKQIHIRLIVVDKEAGSNRRSRAKHAHQRLGAVVPRPHVDIALVENLADVVGMNPPECKRQRGAAKLHVRRTMNRDFVAES